MDKFPKLDAKLVKKVDEALDLDIPRCMNRLPGDEVRSASVAM
jgi:hypothetical protein